MLSELYVEMINFHPLPVDFPSRRDTFSRILSLHWQNEYQD